MLVTILTDDSEIHNIYVNPYTDLGALKNLCSSKFSLPTDQISISFNGVALENDTMKLKDCNIGDGCLLNMQRKKSTPAPIMDIDSLDFSNIRFPKQKRQKTQHTYSNSQNIENISNEIKKALDEKIRKEDINQNFETAIEQFPETFGQVCMLYINCKVNNYEVKAFVDSGAQMTIMSQAFAEKCDLMRLVDTRYSGVAQGVGVQEILGKVHLAQLQIGNIFLPCSFSVLKNQSIDMLLGLDMLKRHQCMIDLMNNELVFGTTRTRAPFLSEGELPSHARLNQDDKKIYDKALESLKNTNDSIEKAQESTIVQQPSVDITRTTSAQELSSQISEENIKLITDNGFPREQAIAELMKSGGLVDEALAALITALYSN